MSTFHNEAEKLKLDYLIDGGTLLGAIRHEEIIPHDDDIDVIVFDKEKLLEVLKNLECKYCEFKSGYKLYFEDGDIIKKYEWKYPFVDILLCDIVEGKTRYRSGLWRSYYHLEKNIYPLKKYKLKHLELWGPNKPLPYLDRGYKDWDKKIVTPNWDHKNEKRLKQNILHLQKKDYRTKYI